MLGGVFAVHYRDVLGGPDGNLSPGSPSRTEASSNTCPARPEKQRGEPKSYTRPGPSIQIAVGLWVMEPKRNGRVRWSLLGYWLVSGRLRRLRKLADPKRKIVEEAVETPDGNMLCPTNQAPISEHCGKICSRLRREGFG